MSQSLATFALYPSTMALYFGAEALRAAQFRHTDISVMYSDGRRALHLHERVPVDDASVVDDNGEIEADPAGVTLAGLLTSLSGLGAVVMPTDGAFMAGGPILATVSLAGTLMSSLRGLGLPEDEVTGFVERMQRGGLLLSVQCDDSGWLQRAKQILEQTGAERVAATA